MKENIGNTEKTGYGVPPKEHQWKPGQSGNPSGRPKGTLKDYVRQKFMAMSVDEKEAFLSGIDEATIWRMGEGNPAQETDITTGGEKIDFTKVDPKQQALLDDYEGKLKDVL